MKRKANPEKKHLTTDEVLKLLEVPENQKSIDDIMYRSFGDINLIDVFRAAPNILKAGSPTPWWADIDDPGENTGENWTGKFYIGDETSPVWEPYNHGNDEALAARNARLIAFSVNALPMLLQHIDDLYLAIDAIINMSRKHITWEK